MLAPTLHILHHFAGIQWECRELIWRWYPSYNQMKRNILSTYPIISRLQQPPGTYHTYLAMFTNFNINIKLKKNCAIEVRIFFIVVPLYQSLLYPMLKSHHQTLKTQVHIGIFTTVSKVKKRCGNQYWPWNFMLEAMPILMFVRWNHILFSIEFTRFQSH